MRFSDVPFDDGVISGNLRDLFNDPRPLAKQDFVRT
jgi:hypothetical protein